MFIYSFGRDNKFISQTKIPPQPIPFDNLCMFLQLNIFKYRKRFEKSEMENSNNIILSCCRPDNNHFHFFNFTSVKCSVRRLFYFMFADIFCLYLRRVDFIRFSFCVSIVFKHNNTIISSLSQAL